MNIYDHYELENNRGVPVFSTCPNCKNGNTYQRFVSSITNISVSNDVGECPVNNGCGYRYLPFRYSKENGIRLTHTTGDTSFVPKEIFLKSLNHVQENNLFLYLKESFGQRAAIETMNKYSIGTSKISPGVSVLWNIDREDKIRTGRIALFDAQTGKESNTGYGKRYVHQLMNMKRFNAVECLFGENLLKSEPNKNVVVVYSERTAIIASCLYPEYLWLAMPDGMELPSKNMLVALSGSNVNWFPSVGFNKIKDFEPLFFLRTISIKIGESA